MDETPAPATPTPAPPPTLATVRGSLDLAASMYGLHKPKDAAEAQLLALIELADVVEQLARRTMTADLIG